MARAVTTGRVNPITAYEKSAANLTKKILTNAEEVAKKADVKFECVHVKDSHPEYCR